MKRSGKIPGGLTSACGNKLNLTNQTNFPLLCCCRVGDVNYPLPALGETAVFLLAAYFSHGGSTEGGIGG